MHQGGTTSLLPSTLYFETLIGLTSVSWSTWQYASRRDYVITTQCLLFSNFDRSDLSKLEYLTMCIKEWLRHYFPVPLFWYFDRSDLSKLESLTMCIKEGLRHYSPVPLIWYFDRSDLSKQEYLTMCIKEGLHHYSPVSFIFKLW